MANPSTKYSSSINPNNNKNYVRQQQTNYNQPGAGRGRGGMVVLSRNRTGIVPKIAPKLSIPPPLNLPSLRKEHEKFDNSGTGNAGGVVSGRPTSSGIGWTKPNVVVAVSVAETTATNETRGVEGVNRGSGSYMPPSARNNNNGVGVVTGSRDFVGIGKSVVLRGEDFPSLQDARPSSSGASQKLKDGVKEQKQKQVVGEETGQEKRDGFQLGLSVGDVRPVVQSLGKDVSSVEMGGEGRFGNVQKQKDFFPDPLPLVRLNPRTDWADDERDTGVGFMERGGRDSGYMKSDNYWERDYDLSKPSVLPHKTPPFHYDRRGQSNSTEVPKVDHYSTNLRDPSREGEVNKWRTASPFSKDGTSSQDVTSGSRMTGYGNVVKDNNKYIPPYHGDTGRDINNTPYRDSGYGNRGLGQHVGRPQWNSSTESYPNRGTERNFRMEQPNRYMGDNFQNNTLPRSSLAASGKSPHMIDPILNMTRDKRFSKGEKPFLEDSFARDVAGFDERDLFSGGLAGVIKRKKDAAKSTDFHDPARESFEAELERVQKMQELERHRIIEEQERVLEQAQREEDERQRRIREEEERRLRLEEEAREAAWRAEQEQLEAIRKVEELKIAREEEKRRIQLEEERRKQAAKQKLLELEAKMAKKQAEAPKNDELPVSDTAADDKMDEAMKEKELDIWEDNERMVDKVTTPASLNSFAPNRPVDMSLRPYPPREGSSIFIDSGKSISSWRREVFENSGNFPSPSLNHEIGYHNSPRRDAFVGGGRTGLRNVGTGPNMPSRSYSREGVQQDLYADEFGKYNREMDSELPDNRYDDYAWSHGNSRFNARPPFPEQLYPNSESNELYSYGRSSRYSVRQPRVLPPPLASAQRTNVRGFDDAPYMNSARSDANRQTPYGVPVQQETTTIEDDQKFRNDMLRRCDSPSSLSVSSPPASPPHLSHDELDESGDSRLTSAVEDGQRSLLTTGSEIESATILNENPGKGILASSAADSVFAVEDEEWTLENDDRLQLQEEYDEDDDGYREEDEVREVDDDLNRKYQGLELEEKDLDNVVLGFDEGVEVVMPSDESSDKNLEIPKEREEIGVPSDEQNVLPVSVGVSSTLGHVDVPPAQQQIVSSSPGGMGSVGVISLPSLSSAGGDTTPVQLQFGLFSGPTLIPSPVPAIQIGSIQMPLHIHAPIGPPFTHIHPSQPPPPVFQFGQLHYTSPISLPVAPSQSSFSYVNTNNMQQGNNVNIDQNDAIRSLPHQPALNVTNDALPSQDLNKQPEYVSASAPLEKSNANADGGKRVELESGSKAAAQVKRVQYNVNTGEKNYFNEQRAPGTFPGNNRGKRFAYSVKSSNTTRSYSQSHDNMHEADSNGYQRRGRRTVQRTEFRVRENIDRRQAPLFGSSNNNHAGLDENNSNFMGKGVGVFTRRGSKRGTVSNRTMKQGTDIEPSASALQELNDVGDRSTKEMAKGSSGETNLRRNVSEEDVDAPLQSGVVRVFKQSGIEAPSDDDDFIEVRSKRQMLNDRREQREKEIKAKSSTTKPPLRKQRFTRQTVVPSRSHNKLVVPSHIEESSNSNLDHTASGSSLSQHLAPIGSLVVNSETQLIKPSQAGSSVGSNTATDSVAFQTENNVKDNVQSSSSAWSTAAINQQVMSLTQTQLDEAMRPVKCDSHISTDGGHSGTVSEPIMTTSSILPKDKSFSSSGASPINSLLAGEKIQFGAVTSPTVLPPTTRTVSHGIGAPGSNRPDVQMSRNFENDTSIFFGKEKHTDEARDEAEAEAAASAVAVAAISSDEIVHNTDIGGISKGVVGDQKLASQSQGDESLTVSLPADLSVETTPISLWPSLPSPLSSSSQMLSNFPGGPHSHFPFYEMNPMLGGPIYTFSPHEESSVAQSQAQISTASTSTSGPVGNWHQAHSGVESYYGPPAGFPGPFVGPPGGIPGVNGPPHMVVYNHFAPVGQYGQVGLSFMGTTYIPSGKQADWKHTPNSSGMHISEGDVNSIGMNNVQHTAPNMTSSIQHLAPGSPLLPMGSPLPMFDVSPFQTAPDMSMQARWSHIPPSPLHSIPSSSRPLHHPQVEGSQFPSQVNHSLDQPLPVNRYPTSSEIPSDVTNVSPFSAELVLQDPLISNPVSSAPSVVAQSFSATANSETSNNGKNQKATPFSNKNTSGHQGNSSGYNYQRGGTNKNNVGNEWSHRRMGFHGRSQSGGVEKGYPASKVKQIYVAKTTPKASSTN